jgi:membrane protein YdbS with pleckstrin-like domain
VRGIAASPSAGADLPIWQQIVFYLGTVIGVVVSSAVTQFQAGEPPTLSITFTTVVIAAIVALVIIPNFYTKVIKEDSPFIVQLGLFVQNGVFWSVMLSAVGKTIS